jgi:hypothetical protein
MPLERRISRTLPEITGPMPARGAGFTWNTSTVLFSRTPFTLRANSTWPATS